MSCLSSNAPATCSVALFFGVVAAACVGGDMTWLDSQSCLGSSTPAQWLSETGCFEGESLTPVDTLLAYEIRAPLWSDGAQKRHYVTLPKGAVLELGVDGNLLLPPGGVLIKEFIVAGRRVETRLLSRDLEGRWHFSTYAWEEGANDARRVDDGTELVVGDETWSVPSLRDCEMCHADSTAVSIGFALSQLDRSAPHPFTGVEADQLETLAEVGWLPMLDSVVDRSVLTRPSSTATLDRRARSYLHSNCAHCHGQGGNGVGTLDLRYNVPFADTGLCNTRPEFGDFFVEDARLLVPGNPGASLVFLRMQTELSSWRMPAGGSVQVDPYGVELVREWISQQTGCP